MCDPRACSVCYVRLQGPTNWSLDDVLSVLHEAPFTPSAKHASKGQLLRREFSRHGAAAGAAAAELRL